jgi:hypothetical protein
VYLRANCAILEREWGNVYWKARFSIAPAPSAPIERKGGNIRGGAGSVYLRANCAIEREGRKFRNSRVFFVFVF